MVLCSESTTVLGTVKLFSDSKNRICAWHWAVIPPESAFSRVFRARKGRRPKVPDFEAMTTILANVGYFCHNQPNATGESA